jgi:parallel beta-helix repeat protein
MGALTLVYDTRPAKANEKVYIRSDGSIDPPTAPITTTDKKTYVFTANIYLPVVVEKNNTVIDGAGYTVEGNGTDNGITLSSRSSTTIKNVAVRNFDQGIYLNDSSGNILSGNNLTDNASGIGLDYVSNKNILSANDVRNNTHGIWLSLSSNNILRGNEVAENGCGVELWFSSNNTLFYNNVTANNETIRVWHSSNNDIFLNNFMNNTSEVYTIGSKNKWNRDYPGGGNYWSNHTDIDLKKGPNQDQPGSDGIIDTPYIVDANNTDRYPLKNPQNYRLNPDLNNDGIVNILDITIIARAFGAHIGDERWNPIADLDNNGAISILDVSIVAKNYGKRV